MSIGNAAAHRLMPVAASLLIGWTAACAPLPHPAGAVATPVHETTVPVMLHDRPFTMHLARPAQPATPAALVLYATGDGGWFGTAIEMWRAIAAAGYPVAGVSARAFLRVERPGRDGLDVRQVATDYRTLVAAARAALQLPATTPTVLAGWSRGAAFSVLAASDATLHDDVQGVVAIGLAERENLRVDDSEESDDGPLAPDAARWPFDNYAQILRLTVPCAVIQATGDNYFPAASARVRLGDDAPGRHLYAITARNHRFGGGGAAFVAALGEALSWVAPSPSSRGVQP